MFSANSNINKLHQEIRGKIQGFTHTFLEFQDFDNIELNLEPYILEPMGKPHTEGVTLFPIDSQNDEVDIFYTIFNKKGLFAPHIHSTNFEFIEVLEGIFYDSVTSTFIKQGQPFLIPPNQPHYITSETGGIIIVSFSKNKELLKEKFTLKEKA